MKGEMRLANQRFVAFLVLALFGLAPAKATSQLGPVADLRSDEDSVRVRAFYEILGNASEGVDALGPLGPRVLRLAEHARRDQGLAIALIHTLETENSLGWRDRAGVTPEAFSNYYGDLVGPVAALRDPRALQALVDVIDTGNMAEDGIAALGAAAIPLVVGVL